MAAKGKGQHSYYEVDEEDSIEVILVLPDERVKRNYRVKLTSSVKEEKERIWKNEKIRNPAVDTLVLTVLLPTGRVVVMDDDEKMAFYKDNFTGGAQIKFEDRGRAVDKEGREAHPENLVKIKRR